MGQAIAKGLVRAESISADRILAFDINEANSNKVTDMGGVAVDSAAALARRSQLILLAPKPQDMGAALDSIAGHAPSDVLFISIAAGVSISFIQGKLGQDAHVARVILRV